MTENAKINYAMPRPASMHIAEWYKDSNLYMGGAKEYKLDQKDTRSVNTTIKACTPFLDSMLLGYMIVLPADIEFSKENGKIAARWRISHDMIIGHQYEQAPSLPAMYGEHRDILKWIFDWKITTPKGYSTLYTHPFNRNELPFRTMTGVVDTDVYPDSVHFPFQMFDFNRPFIIEKDTPICQIIPIKREAWKSEETDVIPGMKENATYQLMSKIRRSYKSQFWSRKEYR